MMASVSSSNVLLETLMAVFYLIRELGIYRNNPFILFHISPL